MGYASRQPTSNESAGERWAYGPQPPHDDFSALVNFMAGRCAGCKRVTLNRYLSPENKCPECQREM